MNINSRQAQAFLVEHFDPTSAAVEQIGEGAWSRCFGFRRSDEELAIRFGQHLDDFLKDSATRQTAQEQGPSRPRGDCGCVLVRSRIRVELP